MSDTTRHIDNAKRLVRAAKDAAARAQNIGAVVALLSDALFELDSAQHEAQRDGTDLGELAAYRAAHAVEVLRG